MNSVKKWYNKIVRKRKLKNSKFNKFCQILFNRFDKKYELQRQQQAEKTRIIKEQVEAKTRAEIFSCKRCSIKYSSNIQLHKHIDEYHIKKIKFEIFTFLSAIQDHKTSNSSFSKEFLMISFSAVILNQTSAFITSSQMSITASITVFASSITS